jgi:15-cis-phytoene desaturase
MLTLPEKLQTAPALLPMLVEGQKFIDLQDELSAPWLMPWWAVMTPWAW